MQSRRQFLLKAMQSFDLLAIVGAALLGAIVYSQRTSFLIRDILSLRLRVSNIGLAVGLLWMCHVVLRTNGLYESKRLSTRGAEVADIVKAISICALIFALAAVIFKIEIVQSRSFMMVFWAAATALSLAGLRANAHTAPDPDRIPPGT